MTMNTLSLTSFLTLLAMLVRRVHLYLLDRADARIDYAFHTIRQYRKLKLYDVPSSTVTLYDVYLIELAFNDLAATNPSDKSNRDIRRFVWTVFLQTSRWSKTFGEIDESINMHLLFAEMFKVKPALK